MEGFEHIENIDSYLSSIERYRPMTAKDEREIGRRIMEGDKEAMNLLINANLKFVVSIAKQYRGNGVSFDDLIEEGNMGLITAAMKFDPSKGCKFITYAVYWIKSYINKRISEANAETVANNDVYETLRNTPTEYDEEELLLKGMSATTAVEEITSCLKEREMQMIAMYFGLNGERESNYKEIGERFGVTSECVRQTVNNSIAKMKQHAVCSEHFSEFAKIAK